MDTNHQTWWTFGCLVQVFPNLILIHWRYFFLAPDFLSSLRGLGFLKANITSKDGGKEIIESFVTILSGDYTIQLCSHIFLSFISAVYVLVESSPVTFPIPHQIQLQVVLGFLNPVPKRLETPPQSSAPASTSCTFFLHLSSVRSSLLTYAGLLLHLLDFLLVRMDFFERLKW